MRSIGFALLAGWASVAIAWGVAGQANEAAGAGASEDAASWIEVPAEAQPILGLEGVHPGMRGYGQTIFSGTTIETFPVEVVSVVPDQSPGRSTIWITSTDARLRVSSGAQGMSGSPIYLWPDDLPAEERRLGENGLLIGAFAFVYGDTVGMLAGVQPIEYMRGVGARVSEPGAGARASAGGTGGRSAATTLARLETMTGERGGWATGRVGALRALTSGWSPGGGGAGGGVSDATRPRRLGVALPLGSSAEFARPLLEGSGVAVTGGLSGGMAFANSTATSGEASGGASIRPVPRGVDGGAKLRPGSVLSLPFAFGDLTFAGHGTVTDVLPDGRVLGFGHSMDGMGPTSLPMATGYVNFVVPRDQISFRVASPLRTAGTMLRDENAAVAGTGALAFETSPLAVRTAMPEQPAGSYSYEVVAHPTLTPVIVAVLGMQSLDAAQASPLRSTLRVSGELRFADADGAESTVELSSVVPDGGGFGAAMEVLPIAATLMDNPFERLRFAGGELDLVVEEGSRSAVVMSAALDRRVVEPGEMVGLTVTLQPAEGAAYSVRHAIEVPADAMSGEAEVFVSGLQGYLGLAQAFEPYRFAASDIDELVAAVEDVAGHPTDAVYVTTLLPGEGLAVGRTALPSLPSSRRAVLGGMNQTLAQPHGLLLADRAAIDDVPRGELRLGLTIRVAGEGF
ncbi:MAG: hypothetical protein AAF823_06525 [Planctomycetota bacterium]